MMLHNIFLHEDVFIWFLGLLIFYEMSWDCVENQYPIDFESVASDFEKNFYTSLDCVGFYGQRF